MQPEVITNIAVGAVLALLTTILAWQNKGRFDVLAKAISDTRSELRDTRAELKAETAQIRAELISIHATITQVALAVRPQHRPEAG